MDSRDRRRLGKGTCDGSDGSIEPRRCDAAPAGSREGLEVESGTDGATLTSMGIHLTTRRVRLGRELPFLMEMILSSSSRKLKIVMSSSSSLELDQFWQIDFKKQPWMEGSSIFSNSVDSSLRTVMLESTSSRVMSPLLGVWMKSLIMFDVDVGQLDHYNYRYEKRIKNFVWFFDFPIF